MRLLRRRRQVKRYAALIHVRVIDGNTEIKPEDLIDPAVVSGDEHAIKFTEACLREWQLNRKSVYLQAALYAVQRFKLSRR